MDCTTVGIDISARTIQVSLESPRGAIREATFDNHGSGHQQIRRLLTKRRGPIKACLESTGTYGLDLAVALAREPRIELGVLNPRAAKRFGEALLQRSKTDRIDAESLRQFAQRMEFKRWTPPPESCLKLRALARRLHQLSGMIVQEKNRLHAACAAHELKIVRRPIERSIRSLERELGQVEQLAVKIIESDDELTKAFDHLCSVQGIADRGAVKLLGELSVLPRDMTSRQWVAHAGLDPRHHDSGTSVHLKPRISKRGNKYLRAALYMPAHCSILHEPAVRSYYEKLLERGKPKMVAKVAVMRKLLHAIYGMFKHDADFDAERFAPWTTAASGA